LLHLNRVGLFVWLPVLDTLRLWAALAVPLLLHLNRVGLFVWLPVLDTLWQKCCLWFGSLSQVSSIRLQHFHLHARSVPLKTGGVSGFFQLIDLCSRCRLTLTAISHSKFEVTIAQLTLQLDNGFDAEVDAHDQRLRDRKKADAPGLQ